MPKGQSVIFENFTKIPKAQPEYGKINKLRIAAYCRVSTDHDDQLVSLETQKQHYILYILYANARIRGKHL